MSPQNLKFDDESLSLGKIAPKVFFPAILPEQISPVCGGKLVSNLLFLAESKISNMFDISWQILMFNP